ncbi:hypothetical protein ACIRNI_28615 [Streptomyces sp. NPDC093546]|uniref:hypothetical protein n=1 Tax=Streptomyces sp. NPDC093546 TaxID=3366040 RepID=UPI0037FBD807
MSFTQLVRPGGYHRGRTAGIAAMPEQLLALAADDPEHDDQEPEAEPREAIDLTALRTLKESRTDVDVLDLTPERLRRLQDAFTKAADASRTRAHRYAEQDDADVARPVRPGDQQTHRPCGASGVTGDVRAPDRPDKRMAGGERDAAGYSA